VVELAGGGTDTIRTSLSTYTLTGEIENLTFNGTSDSIGYGTSGNNRLNGSAQNDLLYGGDGNDRMVGMAGADTVYGGAGADRFQFQALTEIASGTLDVIADFSVSDGDWIDLANIDAIVGTAANDSFTFIGTAAFGNVAGQLRYTVNGANAEVSGDVNGDGAADFTFVVNANTLLSDTDFLL
jgi:Ca2+-binding RTX toxin-like protein